MSLTRAAHRRGVGTRAAAAAAVVAAAVVWAAAWAGPAAAPARAGAASSGPSAPPPASPAPGRPPAGAAPAPAAGPAGPDGEPVRILVVNAPPDVRTGRWDPKTGVWEFDPPAGAWVRVEWGEWQAQARKLRWQAQEQVAELVGEVNVRRPDLEVSAARALVRVSERRSRLEGDVRAVQFQPGDPNRRPLRSLSAQSVDIDEARELVEAHQGVRVEQADPAFWARGDEMSYSGRTGRLVLTARSGVSGEAQGYRLAQAARLEYDTRTGELVLFGPATLQGSTPASSRSQSPQTSASP
ncbi:MAG TPA: hypothetical protein VIL11_00655 [Limnochordales bacterium]